MEPTQSKPIKRRRRLLIVTLVLAVVSMGTWWYWPRGDARFVGKWDVTGPSISPMPLGEQIVTIDRSGRYRLDRRGRVSDMTYWVDGDELFIGRSPIDAFNSHWSHGIVATIKAVSGAFTRTTLYGHHRFVVKTPNEIHLRRPQASKGVMYIMRRIPE